MSIFNFFNLPLGSKICGKYILHEGNHDSRGIPHEQYISKWNAYSTKNNKSDTNKWTKIAEINYEKDNNVILHYIFKIISEKTADRYFSNLVLGSSGISNFNYTGNSVFTIKAIYSTTGTSANGKTLAKVELYVQLYKSYNPVYVMPEFARNTDYYLYSEDYAYQCLTMYSEQPLLDSITATHTPTDLTTYEFVSSQTWGTVNVVAGTTYTITITDANVKWNSIVSYSTTAPMPDGLVLQNAQLKAGGGGFYIKVTNITTGALSFPACTLSWKIRQI